MVEKAKRELVQALALLPVLIAMSNPPDLTPLIFSIYVAQPGNIAHHKRLLLINLLFAWLITACLAQINAFLESPNYFFEMLGQRDFLPAMLTSAICALGMAATLISFRPAHLSSLGVFLAGGAGGVIAFCASKPDLAVHPDLIGRIFVILGGINGLGLATAYGGSAETNQKQKRSTIKSIFTYAALALCQAIVLCALISICKTYVHD